MNLEKSLKIFPTKNTQLEKNTSLENYGGILETLKETNKNAYRRWKRLGRIHYRKRFKKKIINYFGKNEKE